MNELVPGGNLTLPGGAVSVRVPGPFDVSALVTDDGGKVRDDGDFVFYNQPSAPGAVLRGDELACGQRSPADVVEGWMNSPGHRANILSPVFTHIGIGFAGGGRAGTYWTQLFGG